ncbi:hypothetical protein MKEN_00098300 [Mycena kentingensis (nom. inval.)]|nr:hypothetical protein MKEN_00098300 [Mycena kentingensis (nom. inval.)]
MFDGQFDHDFVQYDLPTPPHSQDGSPPINTPDVPSTLVSVSTTFYPAAQHRPHEPDLILLSADAVFFYVHTETLLEASDNQFRATLPTASDTGHGPPTIHVPESSSVLNIILHVVYELSVEHYHPDFDTLVEAVDKLLVYGIHPAEKIHQSSPLFTLLLSHAPLRPLDLYSLASHYQLEALAVPTSAHLLAFPLSRLTDQDVERIGATYLKRLFFLHFGRNEALKRVLGTPPHPHPPDGHRIWCGTFDQTLESALLPLGTHLSCELCKNALNERVKSTVLQWSTVKRTI